MNMTGSQEGQAKNCWPRSEATVHRQNFFLFREVVVLLLAFCLIKTVPPGYLIYLKSADCKQSSYLQSIFTAMPGLMFD